MRRIFITGCPRSGTTMLRDSLTCDPRFFIFNEAQLFNPEPVLSIFDRVRNYKPSHTYVKAKRLDFYIDTWIKSCATFPEFVDKVENCVKENFKEVEFFGDKNPHIYLHGLTRILKLNPGIVGLVMIRDGRSVISSQLRGLENEKPWWAISAISEPRVRLWEESMAVLFEQIGQLNTMKKRIHIIRYEDFVTNTKVELKKISTFLELKRELSFLCSHVSHTDSLTLWRNNVLNLATSPLATDRFKLFMKLLGYIE